MLKKYKKQVRSVRAIQLWADSDFSDNAEEIRKLIGGGSIVRRKYVDDADYPEHVRSRMRVVVEALRNEHGRLVENAFGDILGDIGNTDWLVIYPDGKQAVMRDEWFRQKFQVPDGE